MIYPKLHLIVIVIFFLNFPKKYLFLKHVENVVAIENKTIQNIEDWDVNKQNISRFFSNFDSKLLQNFETKPGLFLYFELVFKKNWKIRKNCNVSDNFKRHNRFLIQHLLINIRKSK